VLAALAAAGRALTVSEVAAQAVRGSEIGVRRSLARLVEQGLVRATLVGRNQVHELNRDHVAADVAVQLSGLRLELWRRLRVEVASWDPAPLYASVFGSAARADGDAGSDIDLLLVHVPLTGEERRSHPQDSTLMQTFGILTTDAPTKAGWPADPDRWHAQVDRLRDLVLGWSGNPLQVVDLSWYEWWDPDESQARLHADVKRDGVEIVRSRHLPSPRLPAVAGG
jgi:predicted nucleotidyltransferase